MNKMMKTLCATAVMAVMSSVASAKLPAPSDEAKAKAAEAAAKAAWAGKVDGFKLCLVQDKVAAHYKMSPVSKVAAAPANGASAGAAPGACVDPGPFVYTPALAVPAGAASGVAPAAATAPAASAPAAANKS